MLRWHAPFLVLVVAVSSLPAHNKPESFVNGNFAGAINDLNCREVQGPVFKQRCCVLDRRSVCFPSFIVAGFQKAGTTSLIGYLLHHPNYAASRMKEVSFFRHNFHQGPKWYLAQFPVIDGTKKITGEATPGYIMGWDNCQKMQNLLPNVKIVTVVRNPVDRSYSEYQMKVRRVEDQKEVEDLANQHAQAIYHCLRNFGVQSNSVFACVPAELRQHPKWKRLRPFVQKISVNGRFESCFKMPNGTNQDWSFDALRCYAAGPNRWEAIGPLEETFREEMKAIRTCVKLPGDDLMSKLRRCFLDRGTRGISGYYLLRSIYQPQLQRCSQFISSDRILILDNEKLRHTPDEEMAKLHEFVGLPPFQYGSASSKEIDAAFKKNYPMFEESSGWRIQGNYAKLPADLRQELVEFFKPFNEQLYAYLGRRFDWDK